MTTPDDGEGENVHRLLLPFVVCQSQGGPYEDQSFVAGFHAGGVWIQLKMAQLLGTTRTMPEPFRYDLLPLLDLIAMQFGYTMEADLSEDPEWRVVWFTKET